MLYLYFPFIFLLSCFLTWALRCYALSTSMLDIPNQRSSHKIPVPRGGGLSFVLCFLISVIVLLSGAFIEHWLAIALLGSGFFIAFIGFMDDRKGGIPARWRLLAHFAAACFALYCLGGMPAIPVFGWTLAVGGLANIFALLYLIWLLNLYNFMDGIDGLAAVEGVSVCLGGVLLYCLTNNIDSIYLPISLAATLAGFLFWNFPPAKIFMGDAGSGFLGLVIGILSMQAATIKPNFFWSWLILLGVFIVDATVTLLRRGIRGEVLFEAHRSHAYQYASRYYGEHRHVTLGVLIINVLWLFPIALAVGFDWINSSLGLLIAYLPLFALALKFNAGVKE
ncbi:putative undecaprenyl-phosphate N-acetylglucosaminyl 1-phosphate transferase [Legionella massiliensis]|uniref:Putative undecaprenyl-phosphate N-acetylglucosaminyl 1-phosphate transferase n=1 Tax=Legionella massiliensis TaxID=1034943 RepID=A0A078L3V7_9GAMM|nr:glycosyltransferase family 4 protein [Legionella massiliensis]CDZ78824.1 putative undecaprenyl-phosphate N-acetylglucosaminyl 1-phosphate transferase [Legionella massiliensis]CEE14562.1 putative undecaprenyl-phosphate N-acetylglucosaminyl 1-phosphate transferase [Legionella massiliensis]